MPLQFILTTAGKSAIVNAANTGTNPVVVTKVGVGSASWTPTASATAMSAEIKKITAVGGGSVANDTIHVTASDTSADAYTVKEVGLFLADNTLVAIYSQAEAIITKGAGTVALIAADLVITGAPAGSITVGDTTFDYPQATETAKGVAELATIAETQAGADDARIITPAKLASVTATVLRRGLVELATDAETMARTDTERAITPSNLRAMGNQIAAWCSFSGAGTVFIKASYNVSSVTDLGPGHYRVNFSNPIGSLNYAAFGSAVTDDLTPNGSADALITFAAITSQTSVELWVNDPSGNDLTDSPGVFVQIVSL